MRITYISAIDGKPSTKQFPDTKGGWRAAEEEWAAITDTGFVLFAVFIDAHAPSRYYVKPRALPEIVKQALENTGDTQS